MNILDAIQIYANCPKKPELCENCPLNNPANDDRPVCSLLAEAEENLIKEAKSNG